MIFTDEYKQKRLKIIALGKGYKNKQPINSLCARQSFF